MANRNRRSFNFSNLWNNPLKPGSATLPFYGVKPVIVDNEGNELKGECEGNLCISTSWPGMMRTVYRNHKRFTETYFSSFKGKYFTGDGCKRDKDGYYWITGRVDDVINVSGHRLGTAEVESALVLHKKVSEAVSLDIPMILRDKEYMLCDTYDRRKLHR